MPSRRIILCAAWRVVCPVFFVVFILFLRVNHRPSSLPPQSAPTPPRRPGPSPKRRSQRATSAAGRGARWKAAAVGNAAVGGTPCWAPNTACHKVPPLLLRLASMPAGGTRKPSSGEGRETPSPYPTKVCVGQRGPPSPLAPEDRSFSRRVV